MRISPSLLGIHFPLKNQSSSVHICYIVQYTQHDESCDLAANRPPHTIAIDMPHHVALFRTCIRQAHCREHFFPSQCPHKQYSNRIHSGGYFYIRHFWRCPAVTKPRAPGDWQPSRNLAHQAIGSCNLEPAGTPYLSQFPRIGCQR